MSPRIDRMTWNQIRRRRRLLETSIPRLSWSRPRNDPRPTDSRARRRTIRHDWSCLEWLALPS
jgi:hypothetical protein